MVKEALMLNFQDLFKQELERNKDAKFCFISGASELKIFRNTKWEQYIYRDGEI